MIEINPSPFARAFLLLVGMIALALGVMGIFIPLLPTTPFLLLASYSFARSNKNFNDWMLTNRFFGKHLQDYITRKTIRRDIKWITIIILWLTIMLSIVILNFSLIINILLFMVAIGVTIHLLTLKGVK